MLGDPRSGPSTLTANSSSIGTTSDLQPGLVDLAAAPRKTVFSHGPNKRPSERGRNLVYWIDKGMGSLSNLHGCKVRSKGLSAESTFSVDTPTTDPTGVFRHLSSGEKLK